MKITTLLSAVALISTVGFATPSFAQDHMMGGKAVAADQVAAVQAKCDELRAAAPAAGAMAPAPAAGAAAPAAPAAGAMAPAGDQVDLATLTVAMCDEGGFTATAK